MDAGIFTLDKRGVWAYYALVPGALEALSAFLARDPAAITDFLRRVRARGLLRRVGF